MNHHHEKQTLKDPLDKYLNLSWHFLSKYSQNAIKKAFVANLRLKEVFMTQMGFHRVYWERGDILKLGAPTSNEMGFQGGSRQTFEHGELRWQPGKGCYLVASGMQCD